MAREEVAASLIPGTHASTFGGNPLACAAIIATIEAIEELEELKSKYSCIDVIRGVGLMLGIQLTEPCMEIMNRCWEKGLRINCTHETVLRFMPAMNVNPELIDQAIAIMDEVFNERMSK